MSKPVIFDRPMQSEMRESEIAFLRRVLPAWQSSLGLRTALDLGCGVGYYSALLRDLGFQVVASDARASNIDEARGRHAGINFRVADAEDPAIRNWGKFDLVLCLGLLYHLENPIRAFRNLHALTGKFLLVESMAVPDEEPYLVLLDEPSGDDQSLDGISCYPSEGAIVKMAYRVGFPKVYRFRELPDHENYRSALGRVKSRTMVAASLEDVDSPVLETATESRPRVDLWTTDPTGITKALRKLKRNLKNAGRRKVK